MLSGTATGYSIGNGMFYKIAFNSEFLARPLIGNQSEDFPGREPAGWSCNRKEMVFRKSDNAIAMRGSCNKYPVTYHSLFKRTSKNNWAGVKNQQEQVGTGSNNKGEVFVSYYGSTKIFKWNF